MISRNRRRWLPRNVIIGHDIQLSLDGVTFYPNPPVVRVKREPCVLRATATLTIDDQHRLEKLFERLYA